MLYGPKAGGAWPPGVSLVGPAGQNGTNGTNGANGTNGSSVLSGAGAPADSVGVNGDFYLDTAAHVLYGPKANGHWPGSGVPLVGPRGPQGPPGAAGTIVCRNTVAAKVLCSLEFAPGSYTVNEQAIRENFRILRGHGVVFSGRISIRRGERPQRSVGRLVRGRYTLIITAGSGRRSRLITRRTFTVR